MRISDWSSDVCSSDLRNMRGKTWSLSVDADLLRVAELVRTGNDDAIAFFQAGHDFHVAQPDGAGLARARRGGAAFDHPGTDATAPPQQRAALHHEPVLLPVAPDDASQIRQEHGVA